MKRVPIRVTPLVLCLIFSLFSSHSFFGGLTLPPEQIVDLVLKILTYDRNLTGRTDDSIIIGILHAPDSGDSAAILHNSFEQRKDKTVAGLSFSVISVSWEGEGRLESVLGEKRFTCLIVLENFSHNLGKISTLTRKYGILSMSLNKEYVNPLSLALDAEEDRIRIYRSDTALKEENVNFAAQFLKITKEL